jgi:hypothetical protein
VPVLLASELAVDDAVDGSEDDNDSGTSGGSTPETLATIAGARGPGDEAGDSPTSGDGGVLVLKVRPVSSDADTAAVLVSTALLSTVTRAASLPRCVCRAAVDDGAARGGDAVQSVAEGTRDTAADDGGDDAAELLAAAVPRSSRAARGCSEGAVHVVLPDDDDGSDDVAEGDDEVAAVAAVAAGGATTSAVGVSTSHAVSPPRPPLSPRLIAVSVASALCCCTCAIADT